MSDAGKGQPKRAPAVRCTWHRNLLVDQIFDHTRSTSPSKPTAVGRLPGQWDESLTIIHYAGQALLLRTLKTGLPDKGLKETFLSPKLKPGMKFAGEFFIIHLAQFGDGSDGLTYRTSLLQGLQQKVLREG